ncbi:MAG: class I SAM-dependent methyltransferase [Candidatus Aenigmarchaeota archaeon]|nr:class I SAM-dependent methyltransferase [Candidatus Aenigmarchaeota archaeon]
MPLQPYEIDSSRMPLCLGSALRVPSYAYSNWGIIGDEVWLREESDRQYEIEWKCGSQRQMQNVVRAITESGLGNYSQILRDENAELASRRVQELKGKLDYLELGAGISSVNFYEQMKKDGVDLERVYGTLIEPSEERLTKTSEKLEALGLTKGKNFRLVVARDVDIPKYVCKRFFDIASYVAVFHHHAFIDTPLAHVYDSLKKNGLLIIADWHNAMWEHPNRVYEFLKEDFEWPTKSEDLEAFAKAYPKALEKAPELSSLDASSNANIKKFWKSWAKIRGEDVAAGNFKPEDDIWMLEAHRPVERQNEAIQQVGYKLDTPGIRTLQEENPRGLVEGSGILYVTLAEKTE